MAVSFYFYDLETSGFSPREARIMQFAGQRTDLDLKPIGEPANVLIKLHEDVLPDPGAILVTGITPQKTLEDGITEAEFLKFFEAEIATPETIFVGYNSVRFDDEFMRFLRYRNFYDAYDWQWRDRKSRWDLLDVVRMTRALRPEGINWPFDEQGRPTNRLELLTGLNNLEHLEAHDALSDVMATIQVAKLLQEKQPKLFKFLLGMRDKQKVAELVNSGEPFVYTSGKYSGDFEKTTVAIAIDKNLERGSALVYDLRVGPEPFAKMSVAELADCWRYKIEEGALRLPIKTLKFNRCPAVAPLGVLDKDSQKRLRLDLKVVEANRKKLGTIKNWPKVLDEARELLDAEQEKRYPAKAREVDALLYDGFFDRNDATKMRLVPEMKPAELTPENLPFEDARLKKMLPLYKARNFAEDLTEDEYEAWQKHVGRKLIAGGEEGRYAKFANAINQIRQEETLDKHQKDLLEELEIYAESVIPEAADKY